MTISEIRLANDDRRMRTNASAVRNRAIADEGADGKTEGGIV
jgi:hypothetical protein